MEKMKSQGGVSPSAEESAKLEEFVTWLVEQGYDGVLLIHKGDVGVSWMHERSKESFQHMLLNSASHIFAESEEAGMTFAEGILLAATSLSEK